MARLTPIGPSDMGAINANAYECMVKTERIEENHRE